MSGGDRWPTEACARGRPRRGGRRMREGCRQLPSRGQRFSTSCSPHKRPEVRQALVSPSRSFLACPSGQNNVMGTSPKPLQNDDRLHLLSEKTKSRSKWLHLPGRLCLVWFSLLWDWFLTLLKAKLGNMARPPGGTLLTHPRQPTGRFQKDGSRDG